MGICHSADNHVPHCFRISILWQEKLLLQPYLPVWFSSGTRQPHTRKEDTYGNVDTPLSGMVSHKSLVHIDVPAHQWTLDCMDRPRAVLGLHFQGGIYQRRHRGVGIRGDFRICPTSLLPICLPHRKSAQVLLIKEKTG